MSDRLSLPALFRAGRVMSGALLTGSGRQGKRRVLRPVLLGLLAASGGAAAYAATAQGIGGGTPDRAAIEAVVRDYILEHPEIIPQAIERLKAREVTRKIDENRTELETPYMGAWEGAAQPKVTLVAFMDYACGYCRASLPDLARLVKDNPDLRIVYRELPIISKGSLGAAKVSLLAAESGKFMAFHRAMYEVGSVEPDAVFKAAGMAGLDVAKAKAAIKAEDGEVPIMENIRLAQALNAEGTPLFIVGDQAFYGSVGYDTLKAAVDKARTRG